MFREGIPTNVQKAKSIRALPPHSVHSRESGNPESYYDPRRTRQIQISNSHFSTSRVERSPRAMRRQSFAPCSFLSARPITLSARLSTLRSGDFAPRDRASCTRADRSSRPPSGGFRLLCRAQSSHRRQPVVVPADGDPRRPGRAVTNRVAQAPHQPKSGSPIVGLARYRPTTAIPPSQRLATTPSSEKDVSNINAEK
jgi:hypothetical protein